MTCSVFKYSVAIRTLGLAGEKYDSMVQSISMQTVLPEKVMVYIAEGYAIPQKQIFLEEYVPVQKGMVRQRALRYDEIESDYILFLDDDVFLPPNAVENLFNALIEHRVDVISPDVFENSSRDFATKAKMSLVGKSFPRRDDKKWAYKALRNAGYTYNSSPSEPVYWSELNAGPCFFCRKDVFLSIRFEEELWLDETPYALPEDQVMYYKFHKCGYKILTSYNSGIVHLDAGSTNATNNAKECNILYSESRNKIIFWHRFFYLPDCGNSFLRGIDLISIVVTYLIRLMLLLIKLKMPEVRSWLKGVADALEYINSIKYKEVPKIGN